VQRDAQLSIRHSESFREFLRSSPARAFPVVPLHPAVSVQMEGEADRPSLKAAAQRSRAGRRASKRGGGGICGCDVRAGEAVQRGCRSVSAGTDGRGTTPQGAQFERC
jgi:hypothetical protein